MILFGSEKDWPFMLDIGRPQLLTDIQYSMWKSIHNFIRESEIEILVNRMFDDIQSHLDDKRNYMGGVQYCFWFKTEENKIVFEEFVWKQFNTKTFT